MRMAGGVGGMREATGAARVLYLDVQVLVPWEDPL